MSDESYKVLKNEALILKEMNHPNIVKFYNVKFKLGSIIVFLQIFETADFIFIEMELIRGGSLMNLMSKKILFSDEESSIVIRCLLSAVEHVHSKNYVHRDLKPENILIDDIENLESIKLADFGLSAAFKVN